MASLSYNEEVYIIQAFNSSYRYMYLVDLLNVVSPYFKALWIEFIHLNYS